MVDPEDAHVKDAVQNVVRNEFKVGRSLDFTEFSGGITFATAVIYDSVQVFSEAFKNVFAVQNIEWTPVDYCNSGISWKFGSSLINYFKLIRWNGLTGHIEFGDDGSRRNFDVEIQRLNPDRDLG